MLPDKNEVVQLEDKTGESGSRKRRGFSLNINWEKFKEVANGSTETKASTDAPKNPEQWKKKRKHHSLDNKGKNSTRPELDLENKTLTKEIAMDCEMVGIGDGSESIIARVSLVNRHGACIYDKYVKPTEKVTDYRTTVSGIRPKDVEKGEDFKTVQKEVAELIRGRLVIGHALKNDFNVLFLSHPKRHIRDTSRYKAFKRVSGGNTPSLKRLAEELLGVAIQSGEHSSVEDARTAMELYLLYKNRWESELRRI